MDWEDASRFFDSYGRRARLAPLLITFLPLGLATLALFPESPLAVKTLWAMVMWCGGLGLSMEFGRDAGKRKERSLFEAWGGIPTTRLLRHRDAANQVLLERRHRRLRELLPDEHIPTRQEELDDPDRADQVYETCVNYLREQTRERRKYPLIFQELRSYGFRRNLWGMRVLGTVLSTVGALLILLGFILRTELPIVPNPTLAAACLAGDILLLAAWIFRISPAWVRTPADAYAEQLIAATERL